ncbi:Prolyl-tRNA editing protein ProX [Shimia sp. SK013]|uniref:prolyl-tRNA synthetase associated domain-containing protein n=1 Tax=Shimia sp. SK013 TaxID=1389006 RepID=UPI0006B5E57E|nr:prolyl-tRNA synthetase associated domain-containing protein [Shimia sp. SK013]KPA23270.1 Prolyl-tRNA editing protein ProX [Shimia sp. SK013]
MDNDEMHQQSDRLLSQLAGWGIDVTLHTHVPLRTVEDAKSVEAAMVVEGEAAFRVKNLYLRDKKKRNYLVTLEQDREIDLKTLGKQLGVGGLSFGSADRLFEMLGIRPGAVSPLAMATGAEKGVRFIIDSSVREAARIYMHPLVNDRTVAMDVVDLWPFMDRVGATPEFLEF